jgi:DNA-binding CsgD family transcriptional regulator
MSGLTDRQTEVLAELRARDGPTRQEVADALGVKPTTVEYHMERLRDAGYCFDYWTDGDRYEWFITETPAGEPDADIAETDLGDPDPDPDADSEFEFVGDQDHTDALPDLSDTPVADDADPDPEELTDRERVLVAELSTGATLPELTERLDERESIVTEHLRDLRRSGWRVYVDETAGHVGIEQDGALRSSEHKGTRTRKANRWWEQTHNALVRHYRGLETPSPALDATDGAEDWVVHVTDLHAGDRVRNDAGEVVYSTAEIPDVVDYVTEQGLRLADKHGSDYDTAHLLWGGDFVTNEGIYEGQFEDLDGWLDEQHESLIDPLLRQLKAFSDRFDRVQVVCQVGNHGDHRASGTSKQANADLILYKSIRNAVAQLHDHADLLGNVRFLIGEARPYKNFDLRGGALTGHLRHGQHRRPQAETSAREKEWTKTLLDHDFDVALMGHYHISGRIPWDGPPIIVSPSPKPAGEFVETVAGGRLPAPEQGVATAFGVSDDGITGVFPVDARRYDP